MSYDTASEEIIHRVIKHIGEVRMSGEPPPKYAHRSKTHRQVRRETYDLKVSFNPYPIMCQGEPWFQYNIRLIAWEPLPENPGKYQQHGREIGMSTLTRSIPYEDNPLSIMISDVKQRFEDLDVPDVWVPVKSKKKRKTK